MYGPVRTVVWADGGGNPASDPMTSFKVRAGGCHPMTWQGARRRNSCAIANHELQRRQVHASACIGRRSGFTLWVSSNTANNLNQNQWLTPALSGQLPDLG